MNLTDITRKKQRVVSKHLKRKETNGGQSFFLALLAAVAAWHELVLLTLR